MKTTYTIADRSCRGAAHHTVVLGSGTAVARLIDAYASVGRGIPVELAEEAIRMNESKLSERVRVEILALVEDGWQFSKVD